MAKNVNKVVVDGAVKLDLSKDSVTAKYTTAASSLGSGASRFSQVSRAARSSSR